MSPSNAKSTTAVEAAAADWFFRRDRGLSAAEQAEFEQWLRADPQHAPAMARANQVWSALDPVFAGVEPTGTASDRDLLAPPRRSRAWLALPLLAAAAALAF